MLRIVLLPDCFRNRTVAVDGVSAVVVLGQKAMHTSVAYAVVPVVAAVPAVSAMRVLWKAPLTKTILLVGFWMGQHERWQNP